MCLQVTRNDWGTIPEEWQLLHNRVLGMIEVQSQGNENDSIDHNICDYFQYDGFSFPWLSWQCPPCCPLASSASRWLFLTGGCDLKFWLRVLELLKSLFKVICSLFHLNSTVFRRQAAQMGSHHVGTLGWEKACWRMVLRKCKRVFSIFRVTNLVPLWLLNCD